MKFVMSNNFRRNIRVTVLVFALIFASVIILTGYSYAQANKPEIKNGIYQLTNAEDLVWFSNYVNGDLRDGGEKVSNAKAELTKDIDMSSTDDFVPIGKEYNFEFAGTFNGNYHKISGLHLNKEKASLGLFGEIKNAHISSVIVEGSIEGNHNVIGGIAGRSSGTSVIENCGSLVNIKNNNKSGSAAGILGVSHEKINIKNCFNRGNITSGNRASGIVADLSFGTLENCYNTGSIKGEKSIGVGSYFGITYINCYNAGKVTSTSENLAYSIGGSKNSLYKNTYYLEGCCVGDPNTPAKSKCIKSEDLKKKSFVKTLGVDNWKLDRSSINSGYPLLSWEKEENIEVKTLETPNNLIWNVKPREGKEILNDQFPVSWNAVEGAEGYIVKLYRNNETHPIFISEKVNTTSIDLLEQFSKLNGNEGYYYFTVTAVGNGENYKDSEESPKDEKGFKFNPKEFIGKARSVVWNQASKIAVWTAVDGADFYNVTLYYDDDKVVEFQLTKKMFSKDENRITMHFLHSMAKDGNYYFTVQAGKELSKSQDGHMRTAVGAIARSKSEHFESEKGETVKISSVHDWISIVNTKGKGTEYKTEADAQNALWSRSYELTADLDFSDYVKEDEKLTLSWGNINAMFNGRFDGKGHCIKGLKLKDKECGLFSYIGPLGVVKNLKIDSPNALVNENAGILALYNYGQIKNCTVDNANITSDLGAIIGGMLSRNYGTVQDSCVRGGELVAHSETGNGHSGFVGNNFGKIRRCYSTMKISTESFCAGGFAGWADESGGRVGSFENCFATGDISAKKGWSGGFIGRVNSKGVEFKNCYASGKVTSLTKPDKAFGFTGSLSGEAIRDINGSSIFDEVIPKENFVNCFYISDINSKENPKSGATEKNSEEMKNSAVIKLLGVDWTKSDNKNGGMPYLADLPAPKIFGYRDIFVSLIIAKYDKDIYDFKREGEILNVKVKSRGNTRVIDVMQAAKEAGQMTYKYEISPAYGSFINSINGTDMIAPDGWMFKVNDVLSDLSVSLAGVRDGDQILWYQGTTQNLFKGPSWEDMKNGHSVKEYVKIATKKELIQLTEPKADLSKNYRLTGDIDLKGVEFKGIGSLENPFKGTFDGGGFTISNVKINGEKKHNVGFFNFIRGATIIRLSLKDIDIKGDYSVGGLVGVGDVKVAANQNQENIGNNIGNCHVTGKVTATNTDDSKNGNGAYAGGLIGFNNGDENKKIYASVLSSIDKSTANVEVRADANYAGGFAGGNFGNITACKAFGSVKGKKSVGGLVGGNQGGIYNSCSYGNVKGEEDVGGFIGHNYEVTTVNKCYCLGDVKGTKTQIGGFAGAGEGNIRECVSAGTVDANDKFGGTGGFIGSYKGTIVGLNKDIQFRNNYGWSISPSKKHYPGMGNGTNITNRSEKELKEIAKIPIYKWSDMQEKFKNMYGLTLTDDKRIAEEKVIIPNKPKPEDSGDGKDQKKKKPNSKKKIVVSKIKIIKVKKLGKNRFKIYWKKGKAVNGYEIRYAKKFPNKKFKKVRVKGLKTVNRVIVKNWKSSMMSIQIRGYKIVKGKTYYSSWSKVRRVK